MPWTTRFDEPTSRIILEDGGALAGRIEVLVNAPYEAAIFHPRVEAGRDVATASANLVEAAIARANGLGTSRAILVLDDRFPHTDAFVAAAPSWGFELDVVKVLVRAHLPELRLDRVAPPPPGARFVAHDPELPDVLQRVLAASLTASDRALSARESLAEDEARCRSNDAFHPEDWVVLRIDGAAAGVVLPAFVERDHREGATNLYVGVVPEFQGRGLGAVLVKRGIETMLARGATRYVGSTNIENVPMLRVFERVGCSRVSTQHLFVRRLAGSRP